jgi:hypothetical protein
MTYTGDEDAVIKIAREAKRNGLSPEDAEVLREWVEEYDVPFRRDEGHPNRPLWKDPHYKIGSQNHIPEVIALAPRPRYVWPFKQATGASRGCA